jgi:hypothetical protein
MGNGEIRLSSDSFNDGVPTKVAAASTWGSTGNVEERRSVLDMEYYYGISSVSGLNRLRLRKP